jgi:hypothetical protein
MSCNIYQLVGFSIENSPLDNRIVYFVWLLIVLLLIIDSFLSFHHTNIFGVFWFYTDLRQWNNIIEIYIDTNQSLNFYGMYLKVTHFIDKYSFKILGMNFFQSTSSPNESQYIPITDAITTTMANENNENEEDSSSTNLNRIVLDLYEKDGKTPKIQLVDNDVIIQPEDILVGFVGLTGRGKSQLLRCLTSNEVFSSGDRPTTYMATGKLCIFNNNHRYWLIDTPVRSFISNKINSILFLIRVISKLLNQKIIISIKNG